MSIATPAQPTSRWRRLLPPGIALGCVVFLVLVVAVPPVGKAIYGPITQVPVLAWIVVAAALLLGLRGANRRGHRRLAIVLACAAVYALIGPMIFASTLLEAKGWSTALAFIVPLAMVAQIFRSAMPEGATPKAEADTPAPAAEHHAPAPSTNAVPLPPPWAAR